MRRVTVLFAVVLVVVATVPVGAVAAGSQATETQTGTPIETTETGNETTDTNTTTTAETTTDESDSTSENDADDIAPGEQLAGVVAVQQAEIDGELESRSFGMRVAEAASNDSKARIVAGQLNESRERLEELRERRSELRAAHEAGDISRGRYQAQAARLTAEIRSLQRLLDRSSDAASELPEETRRSNGIDSEDVERLRTDARNLSGDEVSDIARRVAGPNVGNGLGDEDEKRGKGKGNGNAAKDAPGRSDERGPPSADGSDRGPNADAPGQVGDENESHGELSADAPGRSNGTLDNDSVLGRPTDTDGDGEIDFPGNSEIGREKPQNSSNNTNSSDDGTDPSDADE